MIEVEILKALKTNYIYILIDRETRVTAAVDPGEAEPVTAFLEKHNGGKLDFILNTRHHWDHVNGNPALKTRYGCTIIGPAADKDRIPGIDTPVGDGEKFMIGETEVQAISVPGHTTGHTAYWIPSQGMLFPGDTLFSMGCGRLFEGTPAQMWDSLKKLRDLPGYTKVYCGHEYAKHNTRFALSVDPDNKTLQNYARQVNALREKDQPTVPSELSTEKAANPFLRADAPELQERLGMKGQPDDRVFAEIRKRKDEFK